MRTSDKSIRCSITLQRILNNVCDDTLSKRVVYPNPFDDGAMVEFDLGDNHRLDVMFSYAEFNNAINGNDMVYSKLLSLGLIER